MDRLCNIRLHKYKFVLKFACGSISYAWNMYGKIPHLCHLLLCHKQEYGKTYYSNYMIKNREQGKGPDAGSREWFKLVEEWKQTSKKRSRFSFYATGHIPWWLHNIQLNVTQQWKCISTMRWACGNRKHTSQIILQQ